MESLLNVHLSSRRQDDKRVDCIPCLRLAAGPEDWETQALLNSSKQSTHVVNQGFVSKIAERFYAPFILKPAVKAVVVILFIGLLFAGINFSVDVQLGLPQQVLASLFVSFNVILTHQGRSHFPRTPT